MSARPVLDALWRAAGLPVDALRHVHLTGTEPVVASSFSLGTAAQASVAAAALAACEFAHVRGRDRQRVSVDMTHAVAECTGWYSVDGVTPEPWDKFSGLYKCADSWVRLHTNFKHHRDDTLRLLGLQSEQATRADVQAALSTWSAQEFERVIHEHGGVGSALRTFTAWDEHPQGIAIAGQPLYTLKRIGEAVALSQDKGNAAPRGPLGGVRVLDLTRILAGPIAGRTLAAHGAEVMLVNSPHLPNIDAIKDTSRGKLSSHLDLHELHDRLKLDALVRDCHVFIQGYRPGGLDALGYAPQQLAALRPGIVVVSLSAYGPVGPWGQRRGFDSLVQTATGFNHAEGQAAEIEGPKPMPVQILDFATGFLIAFAVSVALIRQQLQGGSWHVQLSLAQTAHWLRGLPRIHGAFNRELPDLAPYVERCPSLYGDLLAISHAGIVNGVGTTWRHPTAPPGSHAPAWPYGGG